MSSHAYKLVNMGNLIDNLIGVGNYLMQLLEGLKRLIVIAKTFINQTKIVNGFNAISFYTNGFKEELL